MIGWYGKLPQSGDFIVRRLPAAFHEPWDRWLQSAMAGSRERLGDAWRDAYLSMPAWRFALAPDLVSGKGWAGLMIPSADSVGRYFPLTVASALSSARFDPAATLLAAAPWLDAIETVAFSALEGRADASAMDAALLKPPFRVEGQPPGKTKASWIAPRPSEPSSAWLADDCLALSGGLPGPEQYCAMMDGRWAEHGWRPGPGA